MNLGGHTIIKPKARAAAEGRVAILGQTPSLLSFSLLVMIYVEDDAVGVTKFPLKPIILWIAQIVEKPPTRLLDLFLLSGQVIALKAEMMNPSPAFWYSRPFFAFVLKQRKIDLAITRAPHPVGVATDVLARALGAKLSASLGQSIVVENRPGANGVIAEGAVAKAPPDGYTLLITSGAHIANAFTVKKLPYEVLKDFAPATQLAASHGLALITNLPVNSVADLVEFAKKKPGQVTFATNGVGNVTHVAGLLFDARTGVKMVAVPYNTPNLITDVMTGQVDLAFYSVAAAAPLVKSGKIKALALTGSRSPALPNTPTLQELGYKDFDVTGYFGLLFPAGTPHDRIERIYRASTSGA